MPFSKNGTGLEFGGCEEILWNCLKTRRPKLFITMPELWIRIR